MTFATAVKKETRRTSLEDSQKKIRLSDDELKSYLLCISTRLKQNTKEDKLTEPEQYFLDVYGEKIYSFYRELRETYEPLGLFTRTDHNKFVDVFLNNLEFIEHDESYDDFEGNNEQNIDS